MKAFTPCKHLKMDAPASCAPPACVKGSQEHRPPSCCRRYSHIALQARSAVKQLI